ncbi:MAG: hypothetical protein KAJ10_16950 [Thermodesulfovibrionia bacterium]|nr:hypothetical protein [Thermodesulfovibrionia bacterium]
MKKLDVGLAKKLKETIGEINRFMYHLIAITIEVIPGQVKNKAFMNVLKLHKHAFERISKNVAFHGYAKVILLHDPSKMEEKQESGIPGYQKHAIEKNIKDGEKKKMDAEVERRVKEALKNQAEENKEAEKEVNKEAEEKARLEDDFNKAIAGTKAEMNAYIEANSIDPGDAKTNEELIAVIVAWYNAKMDQ